MSLVTTQSLFQYAIASLGQAFTPACEVQNATDFLVTYTAAATLIDTVLTNNVDYVVSGALTNGVNLAPTVTLEAAGLHYAVGGTLTIQRKPPATQTVTIVDGTKYPAAAENNGFNWLAYSIQAIYDIVSRCLQVPATSVAQAPILLAARKNGFAGWDANGNFMAYTVGFGAFVFPSALQPSAPIFLPGITAHTGGGSTAIDGLNVTAISTVICIDISIGDNDERWKLRPAQGGDAAVSDGVTIIVPVTNPDDLRWIRTR